MQNIVPFRPKLDELREMLRPATEREFDDAMHPAIELHGIPRRWHAQRPIYRRLLERLPYDILAPCIWECLATVKWFPLPSEILDLARPILDARETESRRAIEAMVPGAELSPGGDYAAWKERQAVIDGLLEKLR